MSDRIHKLWPSVAILVALALVYIGERVLAGYDTARVVFAGVAALSMAAALVVRFGELSKADEHKKGVARVLLLATVSAAIGLAMYGAIALVFAGDASSAARMRGVLWGLAPVLVAVGLGTAAAVEIAVFGVAENPRYELRRVYRAANRGAGLALLVSALFLIAFVARKNEIKVDLAQSSKTEPSASTQQIVGTLSEPVRVVLFFSRANEVSEVVEDYFRAIGKVPNLELVRADQALSSKLATETNTTENGFVVVSHGKQHEKIRVGEKLKNARSSLKSFDQNFAKALIKVTRQSSIAYFTAGHDERRWDVRQGDERARLELLKAQLVANQYEVKVLGAAEGLASDVPKDAGVVFVMGPIKAFQPEETAALLRYVDRGGRLLIALEPEGEGDPQDALLEPLGLRYDKTILANDRSYVKATMTEADKTYIYTNRFTSHASVSTMGQYSDKLAVIFPRSGFLTKVGEPAKTQVELVVNSLDGTFADLNGNFAFDEGEKRQAYGLGAAVTRTSSAGDGRVFVLADAEVFTDKFIRFQGNPYLFADVITWLRDVKDPVLPTVTEEDVRIVHKRDEDALWFYSSTVGVPLLVALAGLMIGQRRRRR